MKQGGGDIEARLRGAEDLYPMSEIELGMVYHSLEDHRLYHSQMLIPLRDPVFELARLRHALTLLADKHAILRTGLNPTGFEEPIQIVYRQMEPDLVYEDLGHLTLAGQEDHLRAVLAEDLAKPFVFHRPPLWRVRVFRLDDENLCLLWVMHHAITDGWSTACLITELRDIYQRLAGEPDFAPQPLACTYRDFVVQEMVDKRDPDSLDFWRRELVDYPRLTLERRPDKAQAPPRLHHHDLDPGLLAELKEAAQRHGLDLKGLCFAAYAFLLRMLAMDEEVVCGLVTNTRPLCTDGELLAGCFLNTIPVRLSLPAGRTWLEHARQIAAKLNQLKRYERVPLGEIARAAGERGEHGNPFFDVIFNFVNFHVLEGVPAEERRGRISLEGHAATNTWLDFTVGTTLDSFTLELTHRQDVFAVEEVARLCGYYEEILRRLARQPHAVARKRDIMSAGERRRLLVEFNASDHPYPETARSLAELFEAQVARAPQAPAVRFGAEVLTYAELNQRANALAARLRGLGLGPDGVAALCLRRGLAMPVAIWGTIKAGGAYLPIDPDYPPARMNYMLADSAAMALITSADLAPRVGGEGGPPVVLADDQALASEPAGDPPPRNQPGDLAYVIYTSGSTGQPKGAMIEHRALINRLKWMQRRYPIGPGEVILQKTPYTFDVSVWEQVWWALEGAEVCFLAPGGEKDPRQIIDAVEAAGVTVMHFVPSMLQAFLSYLAVAPERHLPRLASLRQVFASGEALSPAQVNQFTRLLYDRHGTRLANLYGPTEAAIDVTWFDCEGAGELESVPIGRPIDNIRLHVLDRAGELQPLGVAGELGITGIGLARGYLNNSALTAERFVSNPLAEAEQDGFFARLYRTGDLVRWRADGNLEFLGRLDHQVKIRGLRIEPGEIENRLAEFPPVGQGLVQAVGPANAPQLAAYLVPDAVAAPLALRVLELEAEDGAAGRPRMKLPNGLPVFMANAKETDFMFGEIFRERCYHWPELSLPADAVVLDVGANLGLFSLWLGRLCPGARILACEPIPELHALLELNCRLHGLKARALNLGLGAGEAETDFVYLPQATLLSSAHPDPEIEVAAVRAFLGRTDAGDGSLNSLDLDQVLAHRLQGRSVRCQVRSLSAILAEAGLSRVDLLKIDVERAELEVLAGIAEADWPGIGQIVMEVHDQGGRLERVVSLLEGRGYRVRVRRDDSLAGAGLCNLFAQRPGWQARGSVCDLSPAALERLARGPWETWPTPEDLIQGARAHLAAVLPDYMVPTRFTALARFPLTGSGKVDRKALPLPARPGEAGGSQQGPRDELERTLARVFAQALAGQEQPPDPDAIDIRSGFFELGGDSLKCIAVLATLERELGLEISMSEFLANLSVIKLAELVLARRQAAGDATGPGGVRRGADPRHLHEPFPLGDIQAAYLVGRNRAYEIGGVATLAYREMELDLDQERMNLALNRLITRHAMLRAVVVDSQHQRILPDPPPYTLAVEDLRDLSPEHRQRRLDEERTRVSSQVFDPVRWPLFEFKALRLDDRNYVLMVAMDGLIMDGASMIILADELARLYADPVLELPELEFSFRDYMLAWKELSSSEAYECDRRFWLAKLEQMPPPPQLPMLCDPAGLESPRFANRRARLSAETWDAVKRRVAAVGLTPTALIATLYARALAFWSNQPELTLNLTLFNRQPFHPDVGLLVGDFTSVLLLDIRLEAGADLWLEAARVGRGIFAALDHRLYSGVEVIRELARRRQTPQRAQMPIILTSALVGGAARSGPGLGRERASIGATAQSHLDLSLSDDQGGLALNLDYVRNLFAPEVIEGVFGQIEAGLVAIAQGGEPPLPVLPSAQEAALAAYNATAAAIPARTLDGLFTTQAQARPEAVAVECAGAELTYAELERQSNRLAHHLRGLGVTGRLVGVLATRALGTVVNLLAVLKAGAGYVPLEPGHPQERRDLMLADSGCVALLEDGLWQSPALADLPAFAPPPSHGPDDVAYVIYTSGSTGAPKGVVISHGAAANTIQDLNARFAVTPADRLLGLSSFSFDLSVYDLFGALAAGARLVLAQDTRDLEAVARLVEDRGVTIWNSVPILMDLMLRDLARGDDPAPGAFARARSYHWSPAAVWRPEGDGVRVGARVYGSFAAQVIPALYFLTQAGANPAGLSLEDIQTRLPRFPSGELSDLLTELIRERVLVDAILTPNELFAGQERLTPNPWGQEILYDPAAYERFKHQQLDRRPHGQSRTRIDLEPGAPFPDFLSGRRSHREFAQDLRISRAGFGRLLAVLRQLRAEEEARYHYASAGGLYPLDVYIYAKAGRVEGLAEGLYYYSPLEHSLALVDPEARLDRHCHYLPNRTIFDGSAFTVFLVYDARASMPKYGGMGYFYACLDAGVLVGCLTQAAELLGIGLCSIGDMDYDLIRPYFHLGPDQVFLHALEMGLKQDLDPGSPAWVGTVCSDPEPPAIVQGTEHPAPAASLGRLRLVMLSGDWISLSLPGRVRARFPGAEVVSLGGATEASIWSIFHPVAEVDPAWRSIPYGRPLANQTMHVLDYALRLCPWGVAGEIFIGGRGLGRCYLGDAAKTAAAFIDHPSLGRLYRTGDYGLMHPEGWLEFLGRRDQQVKIRGHRVELGEIEAGLLRLPGLSEAVVLALQPAAGAGHLLCAFYTAPGGPISQASLREHLALRLPGHMIPERFVHLERLPLTANRKVDRQALAALGLAARPTPEPREAPSDGLEAIICAVACEVAGIADLGANQNIFEAGANSVHVMELTSRLRARLGRELEVASFFEHPTARTLAASLLAQGPGAPGGEASACADRRRLTKRARLVRNRDDRGPTGGDEGAGQP